MTALKLIVLVVFVGMAFGVKWGHRQRTWRGGTWFDVLLLGPLGGMVCALLGVALLIWIGLGVRILFS